MPCNSSEGMGDAYREDPQARDRIAAMQKVLDDHADSLCFLREIVLSILEGWRPAEADMERLEARVKRHREFDQKQGRRP